MANGSGADGAMRDGLGGLPEGLEEMAGLLNVGIGRLLTAAAIVCLP